MNTVPHVDSRADGFGVAMADNSRMAMGAFPQARHCSAALTRNRGKIVLTLATDNRPQAIAPFGLPNPSQVYRVAERFVEREPAGLANRREDNGETKANYVLLARRSCGWKPPRASRRPDRSRCVC